MVPTWFRRFAVMGPVALLIAVAATQMVLARTTGLSPWKGGGFGMFASVDGRPFRWVRIYVFAPARSEEIAVPLSLEDDAGRVATFPYGRAMEQLARSVIRRELRRQQPVESVRVEVWRATLARASAIGAGAGQAARSARAATSSVRMLTALTSSNTRQ